VNKFNLVRIGDVGDVVTGKTPSTENQKYVGNDYMFINPSDLHKHYFIRRSEKMVSKAGLSSLGNNIINGVSVLVGCIGWDMGNIGIVEGKCATNQQINSITNIKNDYNPLYVYYWLKTKKYFLFQNASVTRTPILNKSTFSELRINFPKDRKAQDRIVDTLSTLDQKIELNNRINAELEAIAKLLYEYWFVQFDFPMSAKQAAALGKPELEGKPYKSSGGPMTYNQRLKREIPVGWSDGSILDVAELGGGGTPSKEQPAWWDGDILFFTPTDTTGEVFCLTTEDKITTEGLKKSAAKLYPAGTLFITARGSVGRVVITASDSSMSQSCYALQPSSRVSSGFLYFHIHALMGYLKAKSSGSVFKSIVTNDLKFSPSIVPSTDALKAYKDQTESIFSQILTLQKQNQELAELRDWLLPMLMNGQVTVREAEAEVAKV